MYENSDEYLLKKLWKSFLVSMVLPLLLFAGVAVMHQMEIRIFPPGNIRIWGIILFVFSVTLGAAVPVFLRTSFHSRYVKQNSVTASEYLFYQRTLIAVCSIAVVTASLAYLFIVSSLYMYGSTLAALYGIYSVLPFRLKIENELKIYKLKEQI